MECWPYILNLTFDTTRMTELSALRTGLTSLQCKEPTQMTCVTNPMYNPYSRIPSAWIPLVSKKVSNRELQVDLMCSSLLYLNFMVATVFFHGGSNVTL